MHQKIAKNQLVLVVYYSQCAASVENLVSDFESRSGIRLDKAIIVDNGGKLAGNLPTGKFHIVPGNNECWEFPGWTTGLRHVDSDALGVLVLLNDSYGRNWSIEWPGRAIISRMIKDAEQGAISGWLDNFSRFSRRPNSRIIIAHNSKRDILLSSLMSVIDECMSKMSSDAPLFDRSSQQRLARWISRQNGRWDSESTKTRWPRIFIEHHLFDRVPRSDLALRPKNWFGSQMYALFRRISGERR